VNIRKNLILGTILLCSPFFLPKTASAVTLVFDAVDHPKTIKNGPDSGRGVWIFPSGYGTQSFHFVDVKFTVNAGPGGTGAATLTGSLIHRDSGEPWKLTATFDDIGSTGSWPTGTVPYPGMFDDLKAAGIKDDNRIFYKSSTFDFTPMIANPTYDGPTSFVGKGNGNGYVGVIRYRDEVPFGKYPGSEFDLFTVNGWLMTVGGTKQTGDFRWAFGPSNGPPPPDEDIIPEPMTITLVGLGSVLGFLSRRRKKTLPV